MNNDDLSIILPVFNEEDNIRRTVEGVVSFLKDQDIFAEYEVIAVDDGSTDRTPHILKDLAERNERMHVITHPANLGYGRALVSGGEKARFPWIFIMDADGQFAMGSIKKMAGYIADHDMITGYRYQRSDPLRRVILGKTYNGIACLLFGLRIKDINCGFKLFKKKIVDFKELNCHAGVLYTDIFWKAKAKGCRIKEVPVEHYARAKGRETGASFKVIYEALRDLFRLSFIKKERETRDT